MSTRTFTFSRRPRPARLTVSLSIALGLALSTVQAGNVPATQMPSVHYHAASAFDPSYPNAYAAKPYATAVSTTPAAPPHIVTSCDDDAAMPGTLRYEVLHSVSGDTVDMSSLACSMITLSGWPIRVTQGDLHLQGPTAPLHLIINGNSHSIVLAHYGAGTLDISNLTIVEGAFASDSFPTGGCIYSKGNVSLTNSVVSSCTLTSTSMVTPALGAGVYTEGDLTLSYSTVTDSEVSSTNGAPARGGGAAVKGNFNAFYSNVSDNSARDTLNFQGVSGGVYAMHNVDIEGSTISGNSADRVGALYFKSGALQTAQIINSTISGNTATIAFGGIVTITPLTLTSSTVAFNRSSQHIFDTSDGLFTSAPLTLQSSIIADNVGPYGPSDLGGLGTPVVSGANNLITSSTLSSVPPGTIRVSSCPQLEPLADNGGPTHTHALKHLSPAIDQGNAGNLTLDQRGVPRTAGAQADIGSVEWQPGETDERIFVSGFDGLCDQ